MNPSECWGEMFTFSNLEKLVDHPFFEKKGPGDIFWGATFVEVTSKPSSSV